MPSSVEFEGKALTKLKRFEQMGYKNLYYEDMSQKNYMIQRSTKNYDGYTDKLPGFHFQGNRYPVLATTTKFRLCMSTWDGDSFSHTVMATTALSVLMKTATMKSIR